METGLIWAIGAGTGLALLAGFRAFGPLAAFILLARMEWLPWFSVADSPMDFVFSDWAVAVLLTLVVIEVALTRVGSLASLERLLSFPFSLASAALMFAAAIAAEGGGLAWLAGIGGGLLLGAVGAFVHSGIIIAGEGRDPGPALDMVVLLLAALFLLLPQAGYAFLLVMIWLAVRVRRLKRLKYKGLRVLA